MEYLMSVPSTGLREKTTSAAGNSKRKPRAARLSPEARKAQLLETAIRVFAVEGIGHSNHSQIASQAGVSLASVFAYFPTHEDLTRAVLKEVSRFMLDELVEANQTGSEDALSSIENTLIGFADMIDHPRHCNYAKVWFDWSTAIREKTWPLYLEHHVKVLKVFETTLRRGKVAGEVPRQVKEKDAAWVLVGVGHMIAHMKFAGESKLRITRTIDQLVRSYFHT
jgi:TetR/AcrR family hemagglutinin/protease transcriptional regulator